MDGERSAMENMADSAAIQISFQAFLDRSRKLGVSSLEDDEDFFASFAAVSFFFFSFILFPHNYKVMREKANFFF